MGGLGDGRVLVDGVEIDEGAHAVRHRDLGHRQHPLDEASLLLVDLAGAVVEGVQQVLAGHRVARGGAGPALEHVVPAGDAVEDRADGALHRGQGQRDRRGDAVGVVLEDGLGQRFAEQEDEGHGERYPETLGEAVVDHRGCQRRGRGHRGQVRADQARRDQPFLVLEQVERPARAGVALRSAGFEAELVGVHHRQLGAGEEGLGAQADGDDDDHGEQAHRDSPRLGACCGGVARSAGRRPPRCRSLCTRISSSRRSSTLTTSSRWPSKVTWSPGHGRRPSSWNTKPPTVW